ncbi:MAG TPA: DUF2867 domain-containing protein [Solirubrobacteraceae bacterium]|jgi:hypothetical protein
MRVRNAEHESHRWRFEELAPDFRLEDAWALPVHGAADDFPKLLEAMGSLDPAARAPAVVRMLFSLRFAVGRLLGWDEAAGPLPIPDASEMTLAERLPADLRDSAPRSRLRNKSFTPLYETENEWAAELSNRTVHGVMQLVWIDRGGGRYQGEMGVYVKPRGRLGELYMAAIAPFRHRIVYPALMGQIEHAWNALQAPR